MKISTIIFVLISLFYLFSNTVNSAQFAPYCQTDDYHHNSNIYLEVDETMHFMLDRYFKGFNLTYEINDNSADEPETENIFVTQPVNPISFQNFSVYSIVGSTQYFSSDGTGYFALLTNNDTQKDFPEYTVWFGQSKMNTVPSFEKSIQLPRMGGSVECFDLTLVTKEIMLVDCVKYTGGQRPPIQNYYYLVNESNINTLTEQQLNTFYGLSSINKRKVMDYESESGGKFVVSAILFEDMDDHTYDNNTYINIYRFVTDPPQKNYPNGYLTYTKPIDYEALRLHSGFLSLSDYTVYGSTIFALDFYQGVIMFQYAGGSPYNIRQINYSSLNITHGWGIAVNTDGGYIQMTIAGDEFLYSYHLDSLLANPVLINSYSIGFILNGRAMIQATDQYISLQIGTQVNLYKRWVTDSSLVMQVFTNVQLNQLFYTNSLFLYKPTGIQAFSIQRPSLDVQILASSKGVTRHITSISTWYGVKYRCQITINTFKLSPGSSGIYFTNVQKTYDQNIYIFNKTSRSYALDQLYIGPDLQYQKFIGQNTQNIINNSLPPSDPFDMILDIPHNTTVHMLNPQPDKWLFNRVIAIPGQTLEVFYQLHQGPDLNLLLYQCLTSDSDIQTVNCTDPDLIKLDSAIIAFSFGFFEQSQPLFALTTMLSQQKVQFYSLNGIKQFEANLNENIYEISLKDNQMFIITESNTIDVWTYTDSIKLEYRISNETVKTWPCGGNNWTPQRVFTQPNINNTLFVRTKTLICIISIHSEPRWLSNIMLTNMVAQVTAYAFPTDLSLTIVYSDDRITEYSLQQLSSIDINTPMKQYNTYGRYNLINPVTATISKMSSLLYILGQDSVTKNYVVLIYKTHQPQVNTLYKVFDLQDSSFDQQKPYDIHCDGTFFEDIVYVSFNGKMSLLRVPKYPRAIIYPNEEFPKYQYTARQNYTLQITGLDNSTMLQQEEMIFVNQQQSIEVDYEAVIASEFQNLQMLQNTTYSWNVDVTRWFFGPVMNLTMTCKDCGKGKIISMKNRLQYDSDIQVQNIQDGFWDHVTNNSYLLQNGSVLIYNQDMKNIAQYQLKIDPSLYNFCHTLIGGRNNFSTVFNFTFAICQQKQGTFIVAPILFQQPVTPLSPISLDSITKFGKAEFIDGKLLVLNIDQQGQSAIYVYDLQNDIDQKLSSGTVLQIYNTSYPGFGVDFNISSFEVMPTDNLKFRKLFLTNYTGYLYAFELNSSDYSIRSWDYLNVNVLLETQNQFILSNTTLIGMKSLFYEEIQDGNITYLHYKIAIIPSNTAIYDFLLVFTSHQDEGTRILDSVSLLYVLQNYGNNLPLTKIVQNGPNGEYLSLGYWNQTANTLSIVVYYRDSTPMKQRKQKQFEHIPLRQIIGGVTYTVIRTGGGVPQSTYFFFIDSKQNFKLFTATPTPDTNAQVYLPNWQNITITASQPDFKDQAMTISCNSDFVGLIPITVLGFIKAGTGPVPVQCNPYCQSNNYFLNSNIWVEQGETAHYMLDDYFTGFNLTYEFSDNDQIPNENDISITGRVKQVSNQPHLISYILDTSNYINTNGSGYYSILINNNTKSDPNYDIWFGTGQINTVPNFFANAQLPYNQSIECFSLTNVNPFIMIVDCISNISTSTPPAWNILYIINATDFAKVRKQEFPYHSQSKITNRKTVDYFAEQQGKYIINSIFFDELIDPQTINQTFLNIYEYVTDPPNPDFPYGYMKWISLIDQKALSLNSLAIADFSVLFSTIYILDFYQGLITFKYNGTDGTIYERAIFSYSILNITRGWSLTVNQDGGFIQLTIAGDSQVFSYHFDSLTSTPYKINTYSLISNLKQRAIMKSTDNFISVQIGQEVTIYKRWITDPSRIYFVFQDVYQHQLLYTNNIFIYRETGIFCYTMQLPSLDLSIKDINKEITRTITATSTCRNQQYFCDIIISCFTIPTDSLGIFFTNITKHDNQNVFIENITTRSFPLDQLYIGANLQFQKKIGYSITINPTKNDELFLPKILPTIENDNLKDDYDLILDVPQHLTVQMKNPQPDKWFFNRIITFNNFPLRDFYQLHMGSDLILYFYYCKNSDKDIQTAICFDPTQVQLKSAIVAFTYGIWGGITPQIALTTMDQKQSVQLYSLSGDLKDTLHVNFNIVSLALQDSQLFIVSDTNSVQIWFQDTELDFRFELTSQYVSDWPCGGIEWTPQHVFTHPNINNTFFIQTKTLVCIISVHTIPRYLNNIRFYNLVADVTVHAHATNLALVFIYSDDRIIEYNLQKIVSPDTQIQMQQYPTYKMFNFVTPLTSAASRQTGLIYVMAYDIVDQNKIVLLIYRTHSPAVNTLYQVIDLGIKTINKDKPLDIHSDGTPFTDIVYIAINGQLNILRVPLNPRAIITPNEAFPLYQYTSKQTYYLYVNGYNNSMVTQTEDLIFVNQQTSVTLNSLSVEKSLIKNLVARRNEQQTSWDIDVTQWYFGPVLSLQMTCKDCGDTKSISLKNRVQYVQDVQQQNIMDAFYDHVHNKIYVLAKGAVSVYNTSDLLLSEGPYQLDIDQSIWPFCKTLIPGYTTNIMNYVFAICKLSDIYIVAPLLLEGTPTGLPMIQMQQIDNFGEAEFADSLLLVLNYNSDGNSQIFIYDLLSDIKTINPNATVVQQFNKSYPIQFHYDLNITSFELMYTENPQIKKLFVTNSSQMLHCFDVNVSDKYQFVRLESVNLKDIIYQRDQYITDDTVFIGLRILFYEEVQQQDNSTQLHYRLAVITSNTAVYDFLMSFTSFRNESLVFLNSTEIVHVFQNYGSNLPLRKFRSNGPNGDFLGLGYWNSLTSTQSVVVYPRDAIPMKQKQKINDQQQKQQQKHLPLNQIIGGVQFQIAKQDNPAPPTYLFYHDPNGTTFLFVANSNSKSNAQVYSLNYQNITIIAKNSNFQKQQLTIQAISDYSTSADTVQGEISIDSGPKPPGPGPHPNDKGGLSGGAIAGIVISILVVLGAAGGFFYYKRRQKQQNIIKEDAISMQEPLKLDDN